MPNLTELQRQVARLENELRQRDKAEAEAKAQALAAANAAADSKAQAARDHAAAAEREQVRRGAHISILLAKLDPRAPVNLVELEKQIPAEGFPPGFDESALVLLGGKPKVEELPDVSMTSMGKFLQGGRHNGSGR